MRKPAKPFPIAYIGQSENNISFFLFVIHICYLKVVNQLPTAPWVACTCPSLEGLSAFGFSVSRRKVKSTSVLYTPNLQPGARHPVCIAIIKGLPT